MFQDKQSARISTFDVPPLFQMVRILCLKTL